MDAATAKAWIEPLKELAELLGLVFSAAAAYGILLLSRMPQVRPEIFIHWPAGTLSNLSAISVQLRLFNPAAGSQVVMEMEADRLILEQEGHRCSLSPYALLEPLALGRKNEFEAHVREFAHPVIMIGCGQEVLHMAFLPDRGNALELSEGTVTITLRVRYVIHNPLLRVFMKPRERMLETSYCREITADEARVGDTEKWGWLGRDLTAQ